MNFKNLAFFSLSFILFASCSSDDENPTKDQNSIFGTYKLVAYNTNPPTDINNDAVQSENQLLENNCHESFVITLNEDNSSIAKYTFLELENDASGMETQNIECFISDRSGTFAVAGNILTLSYEYDGGIKTSVFNIDGNKITSVSEKIDLLSRNSAGKLVFVDADLTVILEK